MLRSYADSDWQVLNSAAPMQRLAVLEGAGAKAPAWGIGAGRWPALPRTCVHCSLPPTKCPGTPVPPGSRGLGLAKAVGMLLSL